MTQFNILILMVLAHVIDDFVLQTAILSNLKQRSWWVRVCKEQNLDIDKYKFDYYAALFAHSASWSAMIMLPWIILYPHLDVLFPIWLLNTFIHVCIDDMKANLYLINLIQDQVLHLGQIIMTWVVLTIFV